MATVFLEDCSFSYKMIGYLSMKYSSSQEEIEPFKKSSQCVEI